MYLRQADLFWGLSQNLVNRVIRAYPQMAVANTDRLGNESFNGGNHGQH